MNNKILQTKNCTLKLLQNRTGQSILLVFSGLTFGVGPSAESSSSDPKQYTVTSLDGANLVPGVGFDRLKQMLSTLVKQSSTPESSNSTSLLALPVISKALQGWEEEPAKIQCFYWALERVQDALRYTEQPINHELQESITQLLQEIDQEGDLYSADRPLVQLKFQNWIDQVVVQDPIAMQFIQKLLTILEPLTRSSANYGNYNWTDIINMFTGGLLMAQAVQKKPELKASFDQILTLLENNCTSLLSVLDSGAELDREVEQGFQILWSLDQIRRTLLNFIELDNLGQVIKEPRSLQNFLLLKEKHNLNFGEAHHWFRFYDNTRLTFYQELVKVLMQKNAGCVTGDSNYLFYIPGINPASITSEHKTYFFGALSNQAEVALTHEALYDIFQATDCTKQ